jgi:uncharacterized protein YjlB
MTEQPTIETHWLVDDGLVPNNPSLPLIVYRRALPSGPGAEATIIARFAANGWSNAWVNGIYPFHHYHATAHEILGLARGRALVQLGGPAGPVMELAAGDGVLIPAGVGHCCRSASADLSVVGAYPGGADWDLVQATPAARLSSLPLIAAVAPPAADPVHGAHGPVLRLPRQSARRPVT